MTPMKLSDLVIRLTDTEPVKDEAGRLIAPPQKVYLVRPPGPWDTMNVSR